MTSPHIGDKVQWRTVNGTESGVVENIWNGNYIVRLKNRKQALVNEKSIIKQ